MARDGFRNKTIEYGPGAVIYRPPGEAHTHLFGRSGMVAIVIEIPEHRLLSELSLPSWSELCFAQNAPTLSVVAQLLSGLANPNMAEEDLEEHCLSLLTVFRCEGASAAGSTGIERVRLFLDEHVAQKVSLAELGAMAGLHPAYLVNAFRRRYGLSIGQYRRRRRIALAIGQIWNTRLPLSEIALRSGYYDQSHCTNELRNAVRLTPAKIQKLMTSL